MFWFNKRIGRLLKKAKALTKKREDKYSKFTQLEKKQLIKFIRKILSIDAKVQAKLKKIYGEEITTEGKLLRVKENCNVILKAFSNKTITGKTNEILINIDRILEIENLGIKRLNKQGRFTSNIKSGLDSALYYLAPKTRYNIDSEEQIVTHVDRHFDEINREVIEFQTEVTKLLGDENDILQKLAKTLDNAIELQDIIKHNPKTMTASFNIREIINDLHDLVAAAESVLVITQETIKRF